MIPDRIADFNLNTHAHSLFGGADEFVASVPPRAGDHEFAEESGRETDSRSFGMEGSAKDVALWLNGAGRTPVILYKRGDIIVGKDCLAEGKEAWGRDWTRKRTDEEIKQAYESYPGAGVGVALGPEHGLVLIDEDGPQGAASVRALFQGEPPRTLAWKGRRGTNRLYVYPERLAGKTKSKLGLQEMRGRGLADLEIILGRPGRAFHAALPPSLYSHENGREWVDQTDPAPLPEAVVELLDEWARDRRIGRRHEDNPEQSKPHTINPPPPDLLYADPDCLHFVRCPRDGSPIESPDGSPPTGAILWVKEYRASRVAEAISKSLPIGQGERKLKIWDLARFLKRIYPHALATEMLPYFVQWWASAKHIVRTKSESESFRDFCEAWPKVDAGPFHMAWDRVERDPQPLLMNPRRNALAKLMREMSSVLNETEGRSTFSLSYNQIAEYLVLDPANAHKVAKHLKDMGLVQIVEKGKRGDRSKPTTWRWIGAAKIDNGQQSR